MTRDARFDIRAVLTLVDRATAPLRGVAAGFRSIGLATNFDRIGRQMGEVTRAATRLGGELRGMIAPVATLAGLGAGFGGAALIRSYAAAGDNVAKTADRLGVGIERLQEWRFAAERAGVASGDLDRAVMALNRRIAEAASGQNERAAELFEALGIELRDVDGNLRSVEDILPEVMEGFRANGDAALQTQMAFVLMEESGAQLLNFLNTAPEAMDALTRRAHELGFVMSDEAARRAEILTDQLWDLEAAGQGLTNHIGSELQPVLAPVIEDLIQWGVANRELIAANVIEGFRGIVRFVEQVAEILPGVIENVGAFVTEVVDFLGGWENAALALVAVLNGSLIASVINLGTQLVRLGALALANPVILAAALIAAAAELIAANWESLTEWFAELWGEIEGTFQGFLDFVAGVFTLDIDRAIAGLQAIWDGVAGFFGTLWDGIRATFERAIVWIEDLLGISFQPIADAIRGAWEGLDAFFGALWGTVTSAFQVAWDVIEPIVEAILAAVDAVREGWEFLTSIDPADTMRSMAEAGGVVIDQVRGTGAVVEGSRADYELSALSHMLGAIGLDTDAAGLAASQGLEIIPGAAGTRPTGQVDVNVRLTGAPAGTRVEVDQTGEAVGDLDVGVDTFSGGY